MIRRSVEFFDHTAFPFPGAAELREMMNYFEDYTYFVVPMPPAN
jgi:hypothetical protein